MGKRSAATPVAAVPTRETARRRAGVRVLLAGAEMEALRERIEAATPRVECVAVPGPAAGEAHLGRVDIAIVGGRVTPAYAAAPGLRWLHLTAAGVDATAIPELRDAPYPITHKALASAVPMAEHVLTYILVFARRVLELRALQQAGRWGGHGGAADDPIELTGKTVGLVGLGAVGRAVARRARPFGLRVIGVKRAAADRLPNIDRIYRPDQLRAMLAQSDFVALAAPLTGATFHLIGEPELRAMKRTAYLINVSRGALVDEPALIRALREGWIAGAALDVFEQEPLVSDSPLWALPNAVVTPHSSGGGPAQRRDAIDEVVRNVRRFLTGRPLLHQLNRDDIPTRR